MRVINKMGDVPLNLKAYNPEQLSIDQRQNRKKNSLRQLYFTKSPWLAYIKDCTMSNPVHRNKKKSIFCNFVYWSVNGCVISRCIWGIRVLFTK